MAQVERPASSSQELGRFTAKQWVMVATPIALTPMMYSVFQRFSERWGYPFGWLSGMLVYWVVWCIALPMGLLGPGGVLELFREATPRFGTPAWKSVALLTVPLLAPLFARFLPQVGRASPAVLGTSALMGLAIGVTEEILWRGVYIRVFPESLLWGYLYPSVMFALWHVAPQSVVPSERAVPGGTAAFIIYALFLGLAYGYYARQTGSIRWCTVAHCIHDTLGLSGLAFARWLT